MAIAQLKAVLGLDSEPYRVGMKQADTATRGLAASIGATQGQAVTAADVIKRLQAETSGYANAATTAKEASAAMASSAKTATSEIAKAADGSALTGRSISKTHNITAAFAALARGDFSGAMRSLSSSFTNAEGAALKFGGAMAALSAGIAAGRMLNEQFKIPERVSAWWNKPSQEEERETEAFYKRRDEAFERRRAKSASEQIKAETQELRDKRLQGVDKLESDKSKEVQSVEAQIRDARSNDEKDALRERLQAIKTFYDEDIAAMKKAEADKKAAHEKAKQEQIERIKKSGQESITRAQESGAERLSSIRGVGISPDSMARVGGMLGGERPGLAAMDKQAKIAEAQLEIDKKIHELVEAMNERLAEATGGM
jgi:hypothetical protein